MPKPSPRYLPVTRDTFRHNLAFCLKLFSDSTADATKEGHTKHTAKDGKIQQYAVLAKHIFAAEPGQSALYLQNPARYGTAVASGKY